MTTSLMRTTSLIAISFRENSLRPRSRTSSFRNNNLQAVSFDTFIFNSFSIKINLSQSSFPRNLALHQPASQSRSLRDCILTRSTFPQDLLQEQLEHLQSAQLLADHLAATSFDSNKPQQQQLVQQSFYPKMNKQNLAAFQSQLRPEQPKPAYSRLSLQQLTPSNLLESFQLPSSALLLAILVVIILVDYDKSFQLTMQQLCLPKAQGGELPTAFPPACCTTCSLPAWILMSLSFTVAVLKPFSLASRRSRTRRTRALRTSASTQQPLQRRRAWRQRSSSTTASHANTFVNKSSLENKKPFRQELPAEQLQANKLAE